jgi:hypothetical protein
MIKKLWLKIHFHIWNTHCGISRTCKICDKRQMNFIQQDGYFLKDHWVDVAQPSGEIFFEYNKN